MKLLFLASALLAVISSTQASDRALSSYCFGALREESTMAPYADYLKFQLPSSTEYCLDNQPALNLTFPNALDPAHCQGAWTTRADFQPSSGMTTEERYLCTVASIPLTDSKRSFLAVLGDGVVPDLSYVDKVHAVVRDIDLTSFAPTSEGGYVAYLSLTSAEYTSLTTSLVDVFKTIQPVVDSLKISPIVESAPACSTVRVQASADFSVSDLSTEVDAFLTANSATFCTVTCGGSCATEVTSDSSTSSVYGSELIITGAESATALASALTSDATMGPKILQVDADLPVEKYNTDASWIIQSGNKTNVKSHTPFWDRGITGNGITVGVADSGLDYQSCYFYDSSSPVNFQNDATLGVPVHQNTNHRKVVQYVGYADSTEGENGGHGTHVVGSIVGDASNNFHDGMAYSGKVAFYDIGIPNAQYLNVPGNLATQMFPYAKRVGALLHSNSWGSNTNSYTGDARQIDQYSWDNQDFLVLVAAGNSGGDGSSQFTGSLGAPATSKNCVAVGATQNGNNDNDLAYFSSRGPAYDGRIKPDVVAPGFSIQSADSEASPFDDHCNTVSMAGTSMATPVTAGAAALAQEYFEAGWYPSGTRKSSDSFKPMGALLKAILINGAQRIFGGTNANFQGNTWPNMDQGHGIIELDSTLNFADEFKDQGLFLRGDFGNMPTFSSASDDAVKHTFKSTGTTCVPDGATKEFRATLAWHDYPASTSSSKSLVNDLDIKVVGSDGNTYWPNGGSSRDSVNNAESVVFVPTAGVEYEVQISANTIAQGPQPYAYVVSGCFESPDRPNDTGGGGIFGGGNFDPQMLMYIGGGLAGLLLLAAMVVGTMKLMAGRTPRQPKYKAKRASAYGGQPKRTSSSARRSSGFATATGFTGQGFAGAAAKFNAHRPAGGSIPLNTRRESGTRSSKTKFHGKTAATFNSKKWDGMV
mmetsp:Transcript_21214/g.42339  ORF Transcript_21214/g.42339 Transcript_21214/m.42339 type:complete len:930 (+) Transcript_21214:113-2902(+)